MSEIRTSEHNQRGDVFQRTYAFHPSPLDVAERSRDEFDLCARLDYRARVTEATLHAAPCTRRRSPALSSSARGAASVSGASKATT